MTIAWTTAAVVTLVVLLDVAYRRYATKRIRELLENVPPLGSMQPHSRNPQREVGIPRSSDGVLAGNLEMPPGRPKGIVIFCPELHGNQWTAPAYCEALVNAGFAILAFDFHRDHESNDDKSRAIHWVAEDELEDVGAVINFIEASSPLQHLPIGIFGVSRGGSVAILAACRYSRIQVVAADSAYCSLDLIRNFFSRFSSHVVPDWFFNRLPRWHVEWTLKQALRLSEHARNCRYVHLENEADAFHQPVLLISGQRDSFVSPMITHQLAARLDAIQSIWIAPRAKHNKARTAAAEEFDRRLVSHFQQFLKQTEQNDAEVHQPSAA